MQPTPLLTTPWPLVVLIVAAAAGVLRYDWKLKHGPAARTAARLAAMSARDQTRGDEAAGAVEADLFRLSRVGFRGAVMGWITEVSANIGGGGRLRLLFAITVAAGLAIGIVARGTFGLAPPMAVLAGLGGSASTFWLVQGEMRRRWTIAFLDQLVEAVELLTRSVRAGYAVPAAIRMVGKEVGAPVGTVFGQIADEDDLGIEMRDALRNAARRVDLPDFTFLAIAMVIQRETGGQLGDSLDNLHMVLRKRKEARLKVQALTAEGRMSAMIVGAIPFLAGGGVYLMNPEQTSRLFQPGAGFTMLSVAAALMAIGIVIIRWMVKARP